MNEYLVKAVLEPVTTTSFVMDTSNGTSCRLNILQCRCVICGRSRRECPSIKFHKFPTNSEASEKWAVASGKKWILSAPASSRCKRYRVCQNHFTPDQYVNATVMHRLKADAMPNVDSSGVLSIAKLRKGLETAISSSPTPSHIQESSSNLLVHMAIPELVEDIPQEVHIPEGCSLLPKAVVCDQGESLTRFTTSAPATIVVKSEEVSPISTEEVPQKGVKCDDSRRPTKTESLTRLATSTPATIVVMSEEFPPFSKEGVPQKRIKFDYSRRPTETVRFDKMDHWPEHIDNKQRCKMLNCKGFTRVKCSKCGVSLCLNKNNNCFKNYHLS